MKRKKKEHFLYINGKAIPVSKEVYHAYWKHTNKEDYFMRQQKEEHFEFDQQTAHAAIKPGKEDSLERLLDAGQQFVSNGPSVEDQALSNYVLQVMQEQLSPEERKIVWHFYILGKTEQEVSSLMGLPRTTFQRREKQLQGKLKGILKDFF